jgi:hypothetical protein
VRPKSGERLPHDVEKYPHNLIPHASGEAWGPIIAWRGVSIPPDDLLINDLKIDTQPGHAKFPAVVTYLVRYLDPEDAKKVSRAHGSNDS